MNIKASTIHATLTIVSALCIVPTVTIWRDSVLWVAFLSIWANVVSHAGAFESARAKEQTTERPSSDHD